ncbi:CoA transferase (plasmid) [Streptomyces sp. BI20]|uniref:CoA transferase n=1 Tax=Streptomyces sp. BI20 TaxID=3403460 RepID=UPI003C74CA3D
MTHTQDTTTVYAWAALGGPEHLARQVSFEGPATGLPSRLPVRELARATVAVASLAAAELAAARDGAPVPPIRVNEAAVATAFVSERHLRIDGRAPTSFAPLSGFWRAADGWVRTHANYPHHRARLLAALGIPDRGPEQALKEALAAELAARPAHEIQETVYAAAGLAVAVAPVPPPPASGPPLVTTRAGGAGHGGAPALLGPASSPARGIRVLDLTRVIAGPVATRTLALLGADVLRVDSPRLREDGDAHADTGPGKRSTLLDLDDRTDRLLFEDLLDRADVLVTGYRPGALDRHGLAPDTLLARRPGLIVASLSAWDPAGPWAARRGFDSLVQAATGIAAIEAAPDGRPGVLPAQALDHGTGYLLAAAVLRALTERRNTGAGRRLHFSLAGTAAWLLTMRPDPDPTPGASDPHDPGPWLTETASPYGLLRHARSPIHRAGAPSTWDHPPTRWGTDPPHWP